MRPFEAEAKLSYSENANALTALKWRIFLIRIKPHANAKVLQLARSNLTQSAYPLYITRPFACRVRH
jgi:hypothetical protein